MSTKEEKKTRTPVRNGIRTKRKKEEQKVENTKQLNLEEKVAKEKIGGINNMNQHAN